MSQNKEQWGSRWGFILATAGSAIGLGNIWKFPYITGMNGGAAFVFVYIFAVLLVGLPLMIAELSLGRATGCHPAWAFSKITMDKRTPVSNCIGILLVVSSIFLLLFGCWGYAVVLGLFGAAFTWKGWKCIGFICGVLVPFIIVAYYGGIGGWTVLYTAKSFAGSLAFTNPAEGAALFQPVVEAERSLWPALFSCHAIFVAASAIVVFFGVQAGIERSAKVLMPLLFFLLGALVLRGVSLPGAIKGLKFFLAPDFSQLQPVSVLVAFGQAFFTLSIAMGITMTYGSYLKRDVNIIRSALSVIILDTGAAIMAGVAIFSSVFAMGLHPAQGPGLVFMVVPSAFNLIPGNFGWLWNGLFFLMLCIAALTSFISLLEPLVSYLTRRCNISRRIATVIVSLAVYLFGMLPTVSCANWKHLPKLEAFIIKLFGSAGPSFFELADNVASNWLLPLGGLAIAIFAGWVWGSRRAVREMRCGTTSGRLDTNLFVLMAGYDKRRFPGNSVFSPAVLWSFWIRWITPLLVLAAFLYCIGILG